MAFRLFRYLSGKPSSRCLLQQSKPITGISLASTRTYVSEMRKAAFEGHILRLLRNEIHCQLERSPPTTPSVKFQLFSIDEKPGELWFRLNKRFGEKEEIKVDATMFDAVFGDITQGKGVKFHLSIVVEIFKEKSNQILEFVCSVWADSVEIRQVYTRRPDEAKNLQYTGPKFKELDDNLQKSLYDFLEVRGINDDLAEFLHQYVQNKDKCELLRWMVKLKDFIEKKNNKLID